MKKLISCLITAMMAFTMVPSIAFAGTAEQQAADELAVHSELDNVQYEGSMKLHIEQTNPLYGGCSAPVIETLDAGAINEDENAIAPNGAAGAEYAATVDEAAEFLRAQMVDRQTSVTISMPVTEADLTNEAMTALTSKIFTSAMKHTGKVNEGDSLQWVWQDQYTDITVTGDASGLIATITYTIIYYTTAEQEAALSEAVAALKAELNLDGKSDYEKVKAIYDYMTANISYDYEHYGDDSYKLQYTAFAALVNKTSVCQGYATLFYRMMCEYGIDARVVAGTSINVNGEQEGHSWNIVKFGDKYYNLDATWESTWDEDKSKHDFFLRGTEAFENHTRSAEFTTDEFNAAYPMSDTDYVPGTADDEGGIESEEPETPAECTHATTEVIPAVAATCFTTGLTEGVKCASCGEVLTPQEVVPITDHLYDEGFITEQATTEKSGIKTYTCTACGTTKTEEMPKLVYTYDSGTKTLTFSGEGFIEGIENCVEYPWHVYAEEAEKLVIEDGITGVGNFVFINFSKIKNIDFPDNMAFLGQEAFADCDSLTEVILPNGITFFDAQPFGRCDNLEKVIFGEMESESYVFAMVNPFIGCGKLKTITVPENNNMFYVENGLLYSKGYEGLFSCPAAHSADYLCLKDTTKVIYDYAFSKCNNLKNIELPESIVEVGYYIFDACMVLEHITFNCVDANVTSCLHSFCRNLKTITNNTDVSLPVGEKELIQEEEVLFGVKNGITHWRNADTKQYIDVIEKGTAECVILWYGMIGQEFISAEGYHSVIILMEDVTCDLLNSKDKAIGEVLIKTCKSEAELPEYVKYNDFVYRVTERELIGHSLKYYDAKPPTETEPGWEAYEECTVCGYSTYKEIPAINHTCSFDLKFDKNNHWHECACGAKFGEAAHDFEWIIDMQPTEDTEGSKHQECTVCAAKGKTESIGKLDHTHAMIKKEAVAADCETDGNIEYYTCSECGKLYTDSEGKNEITKADTVVAATGHSWDEKWTVTTPATLTDAGEETKYCANCNETQTQEFARVKSISRTYAKLVYNGAKRTPVTVKDVNGNVLKAGTDYQVQYLTNCKNVGVHKFKVVLTGKYEGSKTISFTINPKATVLNKLTKPGEGQIKVTWQKRTAQVTGYEIQYSTTSNFTKKTTKTLKVKNFKTTAKTIKQLKSKKNYWVKIRTYKTVNGKPYYSAWSKAKKITTK